VKLPREIAVDFALEAEPDFEMILGDIVRAGSARGPFVAAFLDRDTVVGCLPPGGPMTADGQEVGGEPLRFGSEGNGPRVHALRRKDRWTLRLGDAPRDSDLSADLDGLARQRSAFVAGFQSPAGIPPARERLLRKALSVMKVNYHSPCGRLTRRWTTPDRWPHQYMWLWDSAFHGVGMSRVCPDAAKDALLAMLEFIQDDGLLPITIMPDGQPRLPYTQPPILAWAALEVFDRCGDRDWAAECLPYLKRYLDWDRRNRDRNGNGVLEWHIEGNVLCRCGECGLDNSSVYDRGILLDAPDFSSQLANDYECTAQIAERLGETRTAGQCRAHAASAAEAIRRLLWWPQERFFFHRDFEGSFVPVKAISGFMPLFAGVATDAQARGSLGHLRNPKTFGTPLPVPSESLDSGTFCKDMWRGPTWANVSYLVYRGLKRYGFAQDAARLKEGLLAGIQRWYEAEGCLWEFFDCLDITSPRDLDRKQRLSRGVGMGPISDYHWTAVVVAALILED